MVRLGIAPFLECSSIGDKRFSAFYAKIRARKNLSIEFIYQAAKIFEGGITGMGWRYAKGKKALNQEEVSLLYSKLWDEYIDENSDLNEILINAVSIQDTFGQKDHCCQAVELWRIREKLISMDTYLKEYDEKIIVAGSRDFNDFEYFSLCMEEVISRFSNEKIIFITGKARSGADALIIDWCKLNNYGWLEYPADWDKHGKSAGYIRNTEMCKIATELVVFWDSISKGTKHMIDISKKKKIPITICYIRKDA